MYINKLERMKADKDDQLADMNCSTCEFNFGDVCAGHGSRTDNGKDTYGMSMNVAKSMFIDGCEDYGISLEAFTEQEKLNRR